MKFQLTANAPDSLSRSLVAVNPKTGLRTRKVEVFHKGEKYDTKDYEKEFPEFAESVLEIKQQIANANNQEVSQLRAVYGNQLIVNKCGKCGGTKATVLFPLFEEI